MVLYKGIITVEEGKRGGKPCIRNMRITVEDILNMLSAEMTFDEIIHDFPELTHEDIRVALDFSANRQNRILIST